MYDLYKIKKKNKRKNFFLSCFSDIQIKLKSVGIHISFHQDLTT